MKTHDFKQTALDRETPVLRIRLYLLRLTPHLTLISTTQIIESCEESRLLQRPTKSFHFLFFSVFLAGENNFLA